MGWSSCHICQSAVAAMISEEEEGRESLLATLLNYFFSIFSAQGKGFLNGCDIFS